MLHVQPFPTNHLKWLISQLKLQQFCYTQDRRHQKSKPGVSVVSQKGLVSSKFFKNAFNIDVNYNASFVQGQHWLSLITG